VTDVFVSVVPFQGNNASGNQTITDSAALGKTPKAAVFFLSGATSLDTIVGSSARVSVGMTDGTTQRSVGVMAENTQLAAVADSAYRIDTATILQMPATGGGSLDVEAAWVSFGLDEVVINWSAATTLRGFVILFYGDDLQVHVASFASSSSIGGTANPASAPGFQPDALIGVSVGQDFVADGNGAGGMISVGYAGRLSSVTQACSAWVAENDFSTATSMGVLIRNDAIVTKLSSSSGTVTEGTRLEASFDTTTYTITTRNAAVAMQAMYLALAVGGLPCWAGAPSLTATSGDKDITDPGFKPIAMLLGAVRVASVNTIGSGQGNLSLGGASSASAAASVGMNSRDNQSVSDSQDIASNSNVVDILNSDTDHDWAASLVSFISTGVRINVNDAVSATRFIAMLAIGESRVSPAPFLRRPIGPLGRM
jgi:hypothetical protein